MSFTKRSILTLNLASKHYRLIKQSQAKQSITSFTKPALSYFDLYNQPHPLDKLHNKTNTNNNNNVNDTYSNHVISNGNGQVEKSSMNYINNLTGNKDSLSNSSYNSDSSFEPTISSEEDISTNGHEKI